MFASTSSRKIETLRVVKSRLVVIAVVLFPSTLKAVNIIRKTKETPRYKGKRWKCLEANVRWGRPVREARDTAGGVSSKRQPF